MLMPGPGFHPKEGAVVAQGPTSSTRLTGTSGLAVSTCRAQTGSKSPWCSLPGTPKACTQALQWQPDREHELHLHAQAMTDTVTVKVEDDAGTLQ